MTLTNTKITNDEVAQNHVASANDDYVGASASEVKAIFDKLPKVIVQKHNDLIDTLESSDAASYIGTAGDNLQSELNGKASVYSVSLKASIAYVNESDDEVLEKAKEYVDEKVFETGAADMNKSTYDKDDDGVVDVATVAQNGVFPLLHTASDNTHSLVGELPSKGLVSVKFKATKDFLEGESFKINNVDFKAKNSMNEEISGFKAGTIVTLEADMESKRLTLQSGGGGGGGKMVQQLELPLSSKSKITASAYNSVLVPEKRELEYDLVLLGNKVYAISGNALNERNLDTEEVKTYTFPNISYFAVYKLHVYENELYSYGGTQSRTGVNMDLIIHKLNLNTSTRTEYFRYTYRVGTNTSFYWLPSRIGNVGVDTVIFGAVETLRNNTGQILEFNYKEKTIKQLTTLSGSEGTWAAFQNSTLYQTLPNGDVILAILKGITTGTSMEYKTLSRWKYTKASKAFTSLPDMTLATHTSGLTAVQLGEKLLWLSSSPLNSSNSGELDLDAGTISYTKYPQPPFKPEAYGAFVYQNFLVAYDGAAKYSLPLFTTPPDQNPLVIQIFKGDKYNSLYNDIEMLSLESVGQPSFTITKAQQTADRDYQIRLGQYDNAKDKEPIIIVKE